jgi:hypothetical protein
VATEAYGGGTSDLGLQRRVLEYLGIYRTKRQWRGCLSGPPPTRARLGLLARPGGLCPPRAATPSHLRSFGCLLAQKNFTKSFAAFGLRLIWIFCESKTGQKTTTGTWHYVNRLVPKNDIKLIGNHSKTSKIDHKTARNNQKLWIRWRRISIPKLNSCSSSSRKVIKIEFLMWSANNHAHHNLFSIIAWTHGPFIWFKAMI